MRLPMPSTVNTSRAIPTQQGRLPISSALWRRRDYGQTNKRSSRAGFSPCHPTTSASLSTPFCFCDPSAIEHSKREEVEHSQLHFRLPFCLRSACRAKNTPALRTYALLPKIRSAPFRCGLLPRGKLGSPSQKSFQSPREWVASAHPSGKHVPHPADKPK
jgi:hypothetical protein